MPELSVLAGTGGLVAFIIAAVVRVLTHDRDEAAIIRAWKERAEAETARADRYDNENRRLRAELLRMREEASQADLQDLGRQAVQQAIDEQKQRSAAEHAPDSDGPAHDSDRRVIDSGPVDFDRRHDHDGDELPT